MGWDGAYHWTTKAIAVADILKEYGSKVESYKVTKTGIWMIYNYVNDAGEAKRIIAVDLLEKHDGHWMRKGLSEEMGPYECDCPLEFLALVTDPKSEYNVGFRDRVRAYHAAQAKRKQAVKALAVGNSITLSNGWQMVITSVKPLRGLRDGQGTTYRIPKKMLTVE